MSRKGSKAIYKWCVRLVLGFLLLLSGECVFAEYPPGLVLNVTPLESAGAVGGGSFFSVRVGTTIGPATLSVKGEDGLSYILDQVLFNYGGETTLTLIPKRATVGRTLTAKVTARAGATTVMKMVKVKIEKNDSLKGMKPIGIKWRDAAFEYLRRQHPDFTKANGLDKQVRWQGYAPFPPPFIVSHYDFRWGDWHVRVRWHVMVPPDDWKRVFLSNKKEGKYWAVEFDTNDVPREIPYE